MKLFKIGLWKTLTIVSSVVSVAFVTLTSIANDYEPLINKNLGISTSKIVNDGENVATDTQYYKSDYEDAQAVYKAKTKLMRTIAGEGTILLKNIDNALPVSSGKITLLGGDDLIFATSHGGGSMDSTTVSYATKLKDALQLDGLTVNTSVNDSSNSIATIVVIGRVAGEGSDMPSNGLALNFMIKPVEYSQFSNVMKKACNKVLQHKNSFISLFFNGGLQRVLIDEIMYIDVYGHNINYHLINNVITKRGNLNDTEEEMNQYKFIRVNRCYLVNPTHISNVKGNDITMSNGEILHIGRSKRRQFYEKLAICLGEKYE